MFNLTPRRDLSQYLSGPFEVWAPEVPYDPTKPGPSQYLSGPFEVWDGRRSLELATCQQKSQYLSGPFEVWVG